MKAGEKYRPGRHIPMVTKAASAAGLRCGTLLVLSAICFRAEFDRPEATITKGQIAEMTGLASKAIKKALSVLRGAGVIEPIRGFAGGRGVATTYRLHVVGKRAAGDCQDDSKNDRVQHQQRLSELTRTNDYATARSVMIQEGYTFD